MAAPPRILDADSHVSEPHDLWQRYLEPAFRERAPRLRQRALHWANDAGALARLHLTGTAPEDAERRSRVTWEVEGETVWDGIPEGLWERGEVHARTHFPEAVEAGFDAASHVAFLQRMGIERTFLYPTLGLWLFAVDGMDPAFAAALVRAYNDWLRDFCAQAPGVLNPVGALCRHSPEAMVEELRRVAGWGWRAVMVRPNPVGGRILSHPAYEPFWSECERRGVAVAIHEGTHARVPAAGNDRFRTRFARHACSHPMEQMMALLALIEGGVLERHPALRVAFLEAGCGWLPYWLWRLDTLEYENLGWEVSENVRMKPSDYFRRQCFISCEPGEPGLREVVDLVGEGCLLYGSDYPHIDHAPHVQEDAALLSKRLSPETARRILWSNPHRFYGLNRGD
ncbi:MAG: amidohydrolase family protein [Cystobacter sp.]